MKFVLAPGWVKKPEDAVHFATAPLDEIIMGSYTLAPREGNNQGRNFEHDDDYATVLNSIGLKNDGLDEALKSMKLAGESVSDDMLLRMSVAGFSIADYAAWAAKSHTFGIERLEFNFGCPNGIGADGTPERILSFDVELLDGFFGKIARFLKSQPWIPQYSVKLSPYSDPYQLKDVAQMLNQYREIVREVSTNTFPNARAYRKDGAPFLEVANGLGGLSGSCMKPIALGQVYQFRKHLASEIEVAGAGGVQTGIDVRDYQLAGAMSVHIGSAAFEEGPRRIAQIVEEYAEYA